MADLFGEEGEDDEIEQEVEEEEEDDILAVDDGRTVQMQDVLLMRFCPHDSSMLYPQVGFTIYFCNTTISGGNFKDWS